MGSDSASPENPRLHTLAFWRVVAGALSDRYHKGPEGHACLQVRAHKAWYAPNSLLKLNKNFGFACKIGERPHNSSPALNQADPSVHTNDVVCSFNQAQCRNRPRGNLLGTTSAPSVRNQKARKLGTSGAAPILLPERSCALKVGLRFSSSTLIMRALVIAV